MIKTIKDLNTANRVMWPDAGDRYEIHERELDGKWDKVLNRDLTQAEARQELDKLRSSRSGQGVYFVMVRQ